MNVVIKFVLFVFISFSCLTRSQGPFDILNGTLTFHEPVSSRKSASSVNENGFLSLFLPSPNVFKTVSMDVGVNKCKVLIGDFLSAVPHMFVIGVEANHHLVAHFEYSEATKLYRNRALVIPAAVSTKQGMATFNTGAGRDNISDSGSLFAWTDPKRETERLKFTDLQQTVRLIKLSDILKYVYPPEPPLFLWDTLKIDIQGADVDALVSAGDYVKNFVCVVGEFQFYDYDVPQEFKADPAEILKKLDFELIHDGKMNMIWINKRYYSEYLKDPELFGCHRVYDSKVPSASLAEGIKKNMAAVVAVKHN